jgi:CheY-like chemotaxis protein
MSRTILLADDSLTIQKVVELTFADTEYQVVALSSGDELLDRMGEVQPDLVICDIIMPGKDGYEVCQEIKSDPAALHIPVVLLSGTFEPFDRDKALAAGCSEIITKPFEARKLVDTVDRLLEQGVVPETVSEAAPFTPEPSTLGELDATPVSGIPVADVDFATQLSPADSWQPDTGRDFDPEPEDAPEPEEEHARSTVEALDFTNSGFDEMEAAAKSDSQSPDSLPAEGLEFELTDSGQAEEVAESTTQPDQPPADSPEEEAELEGEDMPAFDSADADEQLPEGGDSLEEDDTGRPGVEEETPFEADDTDVSVDTGPGFQVEPFSEPDGDDEPPLTDEISPEAAMESEPWEGGFGDSAIEEVPEPAGIEEDAGDLQPDIAEEPVETPETAAEEAVAPVPDSPPTHGLSDDDVDRIARRVIELATERIEHIAWEVIPDMAEIVVRERIRQLEADVDSDEE